jgi:hypothetical protein
MSYDGCQPTGCSSDNQPVSSRERLTVEILALCSLPLNEAKNRLKIIINREDGVSQVTDAVAWNIARFSAGQLAKLFSGLLFTGRGAAAAVKLFNRLGDKAKLASALQQINDPAALAVIHCLSDANPRFQGKFDEVVGLLGPSAQVLLDKEAFLNHGLINLCGNNLDEQALANFKSELFLRLVGRDSLIKGDVAWLQQWPLYRGSILGNDLYSGTNIIIYGPQTSNYSLALTEDKAGPEAVLLATETMVRQQIEDFMGPDLFVPDVSPYDLTEENLPTINDEDLDYDRSRFIFKGGSHRFVDQYFNGSNEAGVDVTWSAYDDRAYLAYSYSLKDKLTGEENEFDTFIPVTRQ